MHINISRFFLTGLLQDVLFSQALLHQNLYYAKLLHGLICIHASGLTLSNNIFPLCAVIRIEGVFPKNIRVSDRRHEPDTQFMLLAKFGEKLHFYLNVKSKLSQGEENMFIDFWTNTHSGRIINIKEGIVEMEAPGQILDLVNMIDRVPLARVSPNILRNGPDIYLRLEFCKYSSTDVSSIVFHMLGDNPPNTTTLEYFGENIINIPFLHHSRPDLVLPLRHFTSVITMWEPGNLPLSSVYNGFFLNDGEFVPKMLSCDTNDILIIKPERDEIRGDLNILCHDSESGLAEVELKSGYISDLMNEVFKSYSGPLLYGGEIHNGSSMRYYVLDTDLASVFLKALSRFWQMPGNREFNNYLYRIQNLEDLFKGT